MFAWFVGSLTTAKWLRIGTTAGGKITSQGLFGWVGCHSFRQKPFLRHRKWSMKKITCHVPGGHRSWETKSMWTHLSKAEPLLPALPSSLVRPISKHEEQRCFQNLHFHHSTPSKSFRLHWMTFLFHCKFIRITESSLDSKTLVDPDTQKISNCIQQMLLKCSQHIAFMNEALLVFWTGGGCSERIIMSRFV